MRFIVTLSTNFTALNIKCFIAIPLRVSVKSCNYTSISEYFKVSFKVLKSMSQHFSSWSLSSLFPITWIKPVNPSYPQIEGSDMKSLCSFFLALPEHINWY